MLSIGTAVLARLRSDFAKLLMRHVLNLRITSSHLGNILKDPLIVLENIHVALECHLSERKKGALDVATLSIGCRGRSSKEMIYSRTSGSSSRCPACVASQVFFGARSVAVEISPIIYVTAKIGSCPLNSMRMREVLDVLAESHGRIIP